MAKVKIAEVVDPEIFEDFRTFLDQLNTQGAKMANSVPGIHSSSTRAEVVPEPEPVLFTLPGESPGAGDAPGAGLTLDMTDPDDCERLHRILEELAGGPDELRHYVSRCETGPLPKLADLRGIAPGATGKLSSEEFVAKLRDEW